MVFLGTHRCYGYIRINAAYSVTSFLKGSAAMFKRLLCVIISCFIIAALSLSVSADLPNDVEGSFIVDFIDYYVGSELSETFDISHTVPFGEVQYLQFQAENRYEDTYNSARFVQNMTITLDKDVLMYIATPLLESDNTGFNYGWLDNYRQSVNDFTATVTNPTAYRFNYRIGSTSVSTTSITVSSVDVEYHCFYNVPAGNYNFSFTYQFSDPTGDPLTYSYPVGVFFVSLDFDPVGDFISGKVDFNTAITEINNYIDTTIDNALASDSEKLFAINYAHYMLDSLVLQSDIKYNSVVRDFNDDSVSIIEEFTSGVKDVQSSIQDLQMVYFDALSQSVTAEQGAFVSSVYSTALAQLQLEWDRQYKEELDSIISDEDLSDMDYVKSDIDDYAAAESELVDMFDIAEFEGQLQFGVWTDNLGSDYVQYKAIFDRIFDSSDNPTAFFLIVPLSFALVSILLATTSVVVRRKNG